MTFRLAQSLWSRRPYRWIILALVAASAGVAVWLWIIRPSAWTGPVRVGFRHYPPFYYASASGSPEGLAVDVLNAAARRAGLALAWAKLDGPSDAALLDGQIDLWPTTPVLRSPVEYYVTEPWLESAYFLVSLQGSGIRYAC